MLWGEGNGGFKYGIVVDVGRVGVGILGCGFLRVSGRKVQDMVCAFLGVIMWDHIFGFLDMGSVVVCK